LAEEAFFSKFTESLHDSARRLVPPEIRSGWARSLYLSKWKNLLDSAEPDAAIVACDGSIGESSFSGRLVAWVARAIAHIYTKGGEVRSIPEVAVSIDYGLEGRSLFMKALELETLTKAIASASAEFKRVFAVFDGSLYLTFFHYPPRIESMLAVFERYVRALAKCLNAAKRNRTAIIGVSKDSDISYLRARILLDALLQANPSVGEELGRKQRSVRRMADRLREITEQHPKDTVLRSHLEEFSLETSDEALYSEVASEPGFTRPLMLAPQTHFVTEEIDAGTTSWWKSIFRSRLKDRSPKFASLVVALDEYYSQPPIAVSYWKARPELGVHRVDIPSNLLGYEGRCGDLQEDKLATDNESLSAEKLIATLNWLSHEPYVVNPLTEVDAVVRLDRGVYKQAYEPVIIEELTKRGFKLNPRRRSVRDYVLRGY
jgi:hypothetical protein